MAVKVESPVGEVMTIVVCTCPEPEACANRPVPPVTVNVTVSWKVGGLEEVGQETPLPETKIRSPFAAVIVSLSLPTKPPQLLVPVTLVVPTSIDLPRCSKLTVAVMLFLVAEVATPVPDILPLKGND